MTKRKYRPGAVLEALAQVDQANSDQRNINLRDKPKH